MRPRPNLVHMPIGGVVRSLAYQHQQPYTTPNALNVRPQDVFLGRERIGQRPGLGITWQGLTSEPWQCLQMYRFVTATKTWTEFLVGSQMGSVVWDNAAVIGLA